jgi:succinate-semialdehyde dehydrogenase/glutarate-semialdehyde dehydrogenase
MTSNYGKLALYIDGRFIQAGPGRNSEPVFDPATGDTLGELPHATAAELDEAVDAAVRAFPAWRRQSPLARAEILHRTASLLRGRFEPIARIMTLEQGKPLVEARGELQHAIELFDWFAEEGRRAYGRIVPGRGPGLQMVRPEPVGPSALFTPWNFPALTPARKLAAGIAAGCTVVLKASEEVPGTAVELVRALHDAGLPAGVANLVFGVPAEVSSALLAGPQIRKVSFTGSTPVGIHLMKLAAETVKRTTMELGGNAPTIVFEDADYDHAIETIGKGKFRNAGQVCIAPARFLVHESLYDRFVRDFAARADAVRLGSGLDPETHMGPLANARRVEAMERFVADAGARGATVLSGGSRGAGAGFFYSPTVIAGLDAEALLMREEVFGPVAPVVPFATVEEAIALANSVQAGLAGYVFTGSITTSRAAMDGIEVGMLGINTLGVSTPETPFGGVKQSGFGSEGGSEGLAAFLQTRLIVEN